MMQPKNVHSSTFSGSSQLPNDLTADKTTSSPPFDKINAASDIPMRTGATCGICGVGVAKYTCPRCSLKSCSLSCVRAHTNGQTAASSSANPVGAGTVLLNTQMGCSGVRENNAGGYVEMNSYRYSNFMSDYVFLEDIGRKVGDWGRDIDKRRLGAASTSSSTIVAPGAVQHLRGKKSVHNHARTKREMLRDKLEDDWDIDLQFLPEGMERRKSNQSTWDVRSQKGYLTAHFRFHRSFPPSERSKVDHNRHKEDSFLLLSHRNELDFPVHTSLHKILQEKNIVKRDRKKQDPQRLILETQPTTDGHVVEETGSSRLPSWVSEMVHGQESVAYQILIAAFDIPEPSSTMSKRSITRKRYREVQSGTKFGEALRGMTIVEFPTFEVVPKGNYHELLEGAETETDQSPADRIGRLWAFDENEEEEEEEEEDDDAAEERPRKRRKVDPEAGRKLLGGLMAYGEDEEDDSLVEPPIPASEGRLTGLSLAYSSESDEDSESLGKSQLPHATVEGDEVDWD